MSLAHVQGIDPGVFGVVGRGKFPRRMHRLGHGAVHQDPAGHTLQYVTTYRALKRDHAHRSAAVLVLDGFFAVHARHERHEIY